ncbi:hypothetical protein [Actinomadura harenae]|uniref:hypothetical protein n=1 Tax=Actinomadura harenae TaxID=2483351 RepID=UPI0018F4C131|nr:hypothetical protein [Actinomadura harenae]
MNRHDLARLQLEFRSLTRQQEPGSWSHMYDYDLSFERLADAVDAGSRVFYGRREKGPDHRMRCDLSPAYRWPEGAPYDGSKATTVRVTGHGSHYVADPADDWPRALCGFWWAPEEGRVVTGEPSCPECQREPGLVEHLRSPQN